MASRQGVGLVVVSHSRALARAAVALAAEMLHGRPVQIEVAAGLDDTTFGTDAVRIKEAIERVDGPDRRRRPDGPGQCRAQRRAGTRPARRPDGARAGDPLAGPDRRGPHRRRRRRRGGRRPGRGRGRGARRADGQGRPSGRTRRAGAPSPGRPAGDEVVGVFSVANQHGLHARPAARLVSEVRGLDASVQLRNLTTGAGPVPAGSLSRVATLGALRDHQVEVRASGPQAQEAVEHLLTLAARRFDEPLDAAADVLPRSPPRPRPDPCRRHRASPSARYAGSAVPVDIEQDRPVTPAARSGGASSSRSPRYAARSSTSASSRCARWAPRRRASSTPT